MIEDIKLRYRQGNGIIKLIMANVAIHIFLALVFAFLYVLNLEGAFYQMMREWFWFPSDWLKIPFRLWTIVTYMFLHNGVFHLLSNMLILYIFGFRLNDWIDKRHIFPIYFWGGVLGAVFFSLGFNLLPVFEAYQTEGRILGASASVMAIVLATATLQPTATIRFMFIPFSFEMRYIAAAWVLFNIIVISGTNPGGALAHLGGAFMGWFYIYQLRKGLDLSEPVQRVISWFSSKFKTQKKPSKMKVYKKPYSSSPPPMADYKASMKVYKGSQNTDYNTQEYSHLFTQKYKGMSKDECLNTILEKIKRSGYDGLSEDEKIFLNRYN